MKTFYEVTVAIIVGKLKNGKDKIIREIYLVDAVSVTDAEATLTTEFSENYTQADYTVVSAKKSRIVDVIN